MQHEFKTVHVLRGRESSAKAKQQTHGWEFTSEHRGTLRTELTFRRVKPETLGSRLLSSVATFRRLQSKAQKAVVASCALILIAGIIGIVVGTQSSSDMPEPSAAQTRASTVPSAEPTVPDPTIDEKVDESEPTETPSEASEPAATQSSGANDKQALTTANSKDFAALLALHDNCDETIAPFVAKYSGRTIEFDGSIANMANHDDYDTRYDILVTPGDKGPSSSVGPTFKFEDVNAFDLNLAGPNKPDSIGEGDRFRFVARVDNYDPSSCLLFLAPGSTIVR